MSTARELAEEIIAVAQSRGKESEFEEYTFEEGVSALSVGVPVPLLTTIRDALMASTDGTTTNVLSMLIRMAIIPYLEMLDECDPADPDTPAPLTRQELSDLELQVKMTSLAVASAGGSWRVRSLVGTLRRSLMFADQVLDDPAFPFPYAGERDDFRERLAVGSILILSVTHRAIEYMLPDNSEPRTRWVMDIYEVRDLIVKHSPVLRERGVIDFDFIDSLEASGAPAALSEGVL